MVIAAIRGAGTGTRVLRQGAPGREGGAGAEIETPSW